MIYKEYLLVYFRIEMTDYTVVTYKNQKYCVGNFMCNKKQKIFVIDADDAEKIRQNKFYAMGDYVGYTVKNKKINTTNYLHNEVMGKLPGGGKGQKMSVDHISRHNYDNRKANLRIISQSEQNENQGTKERTCVMPKNCGVSIDDLPKCVSYRAETKGGHGPRFVLDLKNNGMRIRMQSTTSMKYSLKDKLIQIKEIILRIARDWPEIIENKNIIENYSDKQLKLMKEYNDILKLSGLHSVKKNLIEIPQKIILTSDIENASDQMKHLLQKTNIKIVKKNPPNVSGSKTNKKTLPVAKSKNKKLLAHTKSDHKTTIKKVPTKISGSKTSKKKSTDLTNIKTNKIAKKKSN